MVCDRNEISPDKNSHWNIDSTSDQRHDQMIHQEHWLFLYRSLIYFVQASSFRLDQKRCTQSKSGGQKVKICQIKYKFWKSNFFVIPISFSYLLCICQWWKVRKIQEPFQWGRNKVHTLENKISSKLLQKPCIQLIEIV